MARVRLGVLPDDRKVGCADRPVAGSIAPSRPGEGHPGGILYRPRRLPGRARLESKDDSVRRSRAGAVHPELEGRNETAGLEPAGPYGRGFSAYALRLRRTA